MIERQIKMCKHNSLFPPAVLCALILVACEGQPTQVPAIATRELPTVVPTTPPPTQVPPTVVLTAPPPTQVPPTVVPATPPPTQVPPTANRVQSAATPATPSRTATIKEIVNKVDARASAAVAFLEAQLGLGLSVGGQVRTGDSSKTRLDFSEGTIVRLGQNTVLTVEELTTSSGNPLTRFQFEVGKLWISLFGGSMEIKTPVGVATVRGSYAVIECKVQPVECTFDLIEGSGQVGGQDMKDLQRTIMHPGGSFTRGFLGPRDVFDFCENNLEVCNLLTQALDVGSPRWRLNEIMAPLLVRAGEPEPGPPPPVFFKPCISRVC